jgi:hypothetical protein
MHGFASFTSFARGRSNAAGRARGSLLLALAALAVIGAQTVGLVHRVEHGGRGEWPTPRPALHAQASEAAPALESSSTDDAARAGSPEADHNCAAIDALTLGDGLLLAAAGPTVAAPPAAGVAAGPDRGNPQPPACAYRARAPPACS